MYTSVSLRFTASSRLAFSCLRRSSTSFAVASAAGDRELLSLSLSFPPPLPRCANLASAALPSSAVSPPACTHRRLERGTSGGGGSGGMAPAPVAVRAAAAAAASWRDAISKQSNCCFSRSFFFIFDRGIRISRGNTVHLRALRIRSNIRAGEAVHRIVLIHVQPSPPHNNPQESQLSIYPA